MLARGDKTTAKGRAYLMVIDPQGGLHEVARRVADVKPAFVHDRMAAIDAASLPSVDEARAAQKVRAAARQTEQHREENSIEKAPPMSDDPPDAQPANQNERDQAPLVEDEFAKARFDATEPDAKLREAWRQPAWSAATIEADPVDGRVSADSKGRRSTAFDDRHRGDVRLQRHDHGRPRHRAATAATRLQPRRQWQPCGRAVSRAVASRGRRPPHPLGRRLRLHRAMPPEQMLTALEKRYLRPRPGVVSISLRQLATLAAKVQEAMEVMGGMATAGVQL